MLLRTSILGSPDRPGAKPSGTKFNIFHGKDQGAYYLEWYEGPKRIRQSVGKDASTAAARRHKQEQILASKAAGIKLAEESSPDGTLLGDAVVIYLEDIKKTKKHKTYAAYKIALEYFLESCTKAQVTEQGRKQHGRIHDVLFFFTKTDEWTWNPNCLVVE